jgi:hypothetical protein
VEDTTDGTYFYSGYECRDATTGLGAEIRLPQRKLSSLLERGQFKVAKTTEEKERLIGFVHAKN